MIAKSWPITLALLFVFKICNLTIADDKFYQWPGITAAEILRGRGFLADELFVSLTSGNVLRVTRGRNPLIAGGHLEGREPILFVHGVLAAANNFLLNSFDTKPKDLTNLNFKSKSLAELNKALANEPSAKSLPLLALNCGHEIWLLDRRGAPGSQQLVGDRRSIKATPSSESGSMFGPIVSFLGNFFSTARLARQVVFTLDRNFWNYSLDEQARVDFPQTIEFILRKSPWTRRVSVVGHSAGGALTLIALSLDPSGLGDKISRAILWSPAYATNNDNPQFSRTFTQLAPLQAAISMPIPPPFFTPPVQAAIMLICASPRVSRYLCERALDSAFGPSNGQQPVNPQIFAGFLVSGASHELAQLEQTINFPPDHTLHKFDFGPEKNLVAYGQSAPPAYDLSVLTRATSLSFYATSSDSLVSAADVDKARRQLSVPHQYHLINTTFNHIGYFFHVDAPTLAVIPSMQELETL